MHDKDNAQGAAEYAILTALVALTMLGLNQKLIQALLAYFKRLVAGVSLPFPT